MELFLFVLLNDANFTKKLKFNYIKNYELTVQIFYNLQSHPTFHLEERLVILVRRRLALCWSIYILIPAPWKLELYVPMIPDMVQL